MTDILLTEVERLTAVIANVAVTAAEELDAPSSPRHLMPEPWRQGWAAGYTAACDAVRAALSEGGER